MGHDRPVCEFGRVHYYRLTVEACKAGDTLPFSRSASVSEAWPSYMVTPYPSTQEMISTTNITISRKNQSFSNQTKLVSCLSLAICSLDKENYHLHQRDTKRPYTDWLSIQCSLVPRLHRSIAYLILYTPVVSSLSSLSTSNRSSKTVVCLW